MNIQIYGKKKCFDTQKAERYFKERKIPFQQIDLPKYGMSKGELKSVLQAVKSIDALLDEKGKDAALIRYLAHQEDQIEKLLEQPENLKTPIVRNGKQATVGFCPDIWKDWK